MTIVATDIDMIRKRGREAHDLATIALVFVATYLVVEVVIAPLLKGGADLALMAAHARDGLIKVVPAAIFGQGLWRARDVFGRVGAGDVFSFANAAGLRDIGWAVIWGALAASLTPAAQGLVARGGFIAGMEVWHLLLVALGGAILLFGRIWALAVEIKTEADQII
jgi:hypothetical protein